VRVDAVLAHDRLHAGAQAARTLLEQDRRPPADRADLYRRMAELKGIARGGGPLAANALLRLAAFCAAAFRDATTAPARARPRILAMCLYPLYDSDPEPYLAEDPARRPPEPAWEDLRDELEKLLGGLAAQPSRVAPLAATDTLL
jgi:hypothetical protein